MSNKNKKRDLDTSVFNNAKQILKFKKEWSKICKELKESGIDLSKIELSCDRKDIKND